MQAWGAGVAVAALLLSGCFAPVPATPGDGAASVRFEAPRVVDPSRGGFEPSIAVGPEAIIVCSMRGVGGGTDVWRSDDRGETFAYVGTEVAPLLPVLRTGPGDVGGGDCDVDLDEGGRAYLVDLWGGGVSIAISEDDGASWAGSPVTIARTPLDRPWVLGGADGEVFVLANHVGSDPLATGGLWVARSTDGGQTFPQQVMAVSNEGRVGLHSNLVQAGDRLILAYWREEGRLMRFFVASSDDAGATWTETPGPEQPIEPGRCRGPVMFPILAAVDGRHIALVWTAQAEGTERVELFVSMTSDGGVTWSEPRAVMTEAPRTRAFPWAAAAPTGEIGIVWYETDTNARIVSQGVTCVWEGAAEATWFLRYASLRVVGDGIVTVPAVVDPEPVHIGDLDRPYAERIQVAFDEDARANLVYVADRDGGPRVVFARQER